MLLTLFFLSFVVFTLTVFAMAIGVIFGRTALRGSCGGLDKAGDCEGCSGKCINAKLT
ncbi:MAG: hypothetical protein OER80_03860 [Gammaproteobacteria bacterium]|nr:hypothetical protein [Gammaproteobacteria bacterium]MDH3767483.1 hypothetical protein [Gammaproteobacteria bacterium]